MKLIVVGATGFVGTEVIRLALQNKNITSIIALARKEVSIPAHTSQEADTSKLHSVILSDWMQPYPDHVIEHLRGADACVWTLAVTPTKSQDMDFDEVTKICYDYTINGINNMLSVANKPFRFVYTSGVAAERDQSKTLPFLHDFRLMRGRIENSLLHLATQHTPNLEVVITKPGGIEGTGHPKNDALTGILAQYGPTPWVHVSEVATTMIEVAMKGSNVDTLWGKEIQEIGAGMLREGDYNNAE